MSLSGTDNSGDIFEETHYDETDVSEFSNTGNSKRFVTSSSNEDEDFNASNIESSSVTDENEDSSRDGNTGNKNLKDISREPKYHEANDSDLVVTRNKKAGKKFQITSDSEDDDFNAPCAQSSPDKMKESAITGNFNRKEKTQNDSMNKYDTGTDEEDSNTSSTNSSPVSDKQKESIIRINSTNQIENTAANFKEKISSKATSQTDQDQLIVDPSISQYSHGTENYNTDGEHDLSDEVEEIKDTSTHVSISSSSSEELLPIANYSGNKSHKQFTAKAILDPQIIQSSNQNKLQEVNEDTNVKSPTTNSPSDYEKQKSLVDELKREYLRTTNLIMTLDMDKLPDKGVRLRENRTFLQTRLEEAEEVLNNMVVSKVEQHQHMKSVPNWQLLQAEAAAVQPKTFGERALATISHQRALTMERLEQLHKSLATCPQETDKFDDPLGLKVELLPHQKEALNWLTWREKQKPSGGILADDMGLGKTLTMISLILKSMELHQEENESSDEESDSEDGRDDKHLGGTLIVCPASLINHWENEIYDKLKRNKLSIEIFHGNKREGRARKLAKFDVVITTYSVVNVESKKGGVIYGIKWRRIILDEAHNIRNYKSLTAVAVCDLSAKSRWALTGTPVHNKELDLFSLLKFLRCSPFDDLAVWKRWVANKTTGGQDRLNTVISSLLLRRTKTQLVAKGSLQSLPQREWKLIEINLDKSEMDVYQRLLILSKTLFAQYLHQRAEKNGHDAYTINSDPNSEYYKMHKKLVLLNKAKSIKQHEILVLLLKLRQMCCHPHLVKSTINLDENLDPGDNEELDLLDQLNKMNLSDNQENVPTNNLNDIPVSVSEAVDSVLPDSRLFNKNHMSSKIKAILKIIKEDVLSKDDKCIVVSQWTSLLDLIAIHLDHERIKFTKLDGRVPIPNRMPIVDAINNASDPTRILLLSLTAGGVGLNLVGANHLLLLDLHWNPQLEMQAQDRIYRYGQKKPVFIYKFMALHTIEQQVLELQKKKVALADAVLSGAKIQQTKLSLDDLKMLFNM